MGRKTQHDEETKVAAVPYLFRIASLKIQTLLARGNRTDAAALLPRMRRLAGDDTKLIGECDELAREFGV